MLRVDDVQLPMVHPKKAFMMGALEKEIRLSFAARIRGTLPEPYQPLISEAKEKDTPDFKYDSDRRHRILVVQKCMKLIHKGMPYSESAREILRLLRAKAPDTDLQAPLSTIEEAAESLGVVDPLVPSTDAYVTAICFLGSKSLSHVLSQIERCKDRLLSIGVQSELARRQIITSVMEYWQEKPGIGVNVVDKLLNYTILTPISVVLWGLNDQLGKGDALVLSQTFEMVSSTVTKVTNRVRQIVVARNQPGLPGDQVAILDETLSKERDEMGKLFDVIEDGLVGVAGGIVDDLLESADQDLQGEAMLRGWGRRWLRVFRRKMAVEEAWVQETLSTAVQEFNGSGMETRVEQNDNGITLGNGAGKEMDEEEAFDEIL